MTKRLASRTETRQTWMERIERLERHPGTRSAFCKQEGISPASLNYWLKKQGDFRGPGEVPQRRSAFAAVEIISEPCPRQNEVSGLPDPRWTAEFLRHLLSVSP